MSEMIERVALAIHKRRNSPDDGWPWFHEDPSKCRLSHQLARAAIEAMQEPTEAMCRAADVLGAVNKGVLVTAPPSEAWRAMIDEALK